MYLFKKVIQFREQAGPEHEKPFLEHLEDLRVMITRIVITLLVSMTICFSFQKQLMELLRRPVEQVRVSQVNASLPDTASGRRIDAEGWGRAKTLEQAASQLDPAQRDWLYRSHPDPDLVFHAKSIAWLRAARALPEDRRAAFLQGSGAGRELIDRVSALLASGADPDGVLRGNLRLMSALKPTETFMLSMKLSFFGGIVISFPLLLMFVLQFVLPGLHDNEKKILWPAMAVGFGLFLCGALFAYFVVLPRALGFFYGWSDGLGVSNDWRIGEYISFATQFTLLFGLSFELPVVVMVLVKLGLLSYEMMSSTRMYAVLAIFVIAALITPTPDAFTLLLMALPMIALYELCIWLAWFDRRRLRIEEEREAREAEERRLLLPVADLPDPDDPDDPDLAGRRDEVADASADAQPGDAWAVLPPAQEMPEDHPEPQASEPAGHPVTDEHASSVGDDVMPYFTQQEFHYDGPSATELPDDRGPDESRSHHDR